LALLTTWVNTEDLNVHTATRPPARTLLAKSRDYHTTLGICISLLVITACGTGIFLNHADTFLGRPGPDRRITGALTTTTELAALPVRFESVLARARAEWGDIAIEKVELKDEGRALHYLVKGDGQRELRGDARTGTLTVKDGYATKTASRDGAVEARGTDWKKLFTDIHTGKVVGTAGRLAVDAVALTLMVLTVTGIHLWMMPKLRRRAARRAADQTSIGCPPRVQVMPAEVRLAARSVRATTRMPPSDPPPRRSC
jgi:hypothetical protein